MASQVVKEAEACELAGNIVQAGALYTTAADNGHARAQWQLGYAYEDGLLGLKIDFEMALIWFKKAAAGGGNVFSRDAQFRLGKAHEFGELTLAIDL